MASSAEPTDSLIPGDAVQQIQPTAIDLLLRQVLTQAARVYAVAAIGAPYLLSVTQRIPQPLTGVYAAMDGPWGEHTQPVETGEYRLPFLPIDDLVQIDRILRPLYDQVHQMFGREESPKCTADGAWIER